MDFDYELEKQMHPENFAEDAPEPNEPETTNDKCSNKCGALLLKWTEANGDDYKTVYYCPQCEEKFDE